MRFTKQREWRSANPMRSATRTPLTRSFSFERLEQRQVLSIGPSLVADISPGASSSNPRNFIGYVNDKLLFTATTELGSELWATEGVRTNTFLVKDIRPGANSSTPTNFAIMNNRLFFSANDGVNGRELWVSDGTRAGTVMLKNINTVTSGASSNPSYLTAADGKLYFSADDGRNGIELWVSDGTSAGTRLLRNINATAANRSSSPQGFVRKGNFLYFAANDGVNGNELWRTTLSSGDTRLLRNVLPGAASSNPRELAVLGDHLYFTVDAGRGFRELRRTSGFITADDVVYFARRPGDPFNYDIRNPSLLKASGGKLYMNAEISVFIIGCCGEGIPADEFITFGRELAFLSPSDTFAEFVDIATGVTSSSPSEFADHSGEVYFSAFTAASGFEPWRSNGSQAGTLQVRDILPGVGGSLPRQFTSLAGAVVFSASAVNSERRLWVSQGTAPTTTQVLGGVPDNPLIVGAERFFASPARDFVYFAGSYAGGNELWKFSPTLANNPSNIACVIDAQNSCVTNTTLTQGTRREAVFVFEARQNWWDPNDVTLTAESLNTAILPDTGIELRRISGARWRLGVKLPPSSVGNVDIRLTARHPDGVVSVKTHSLSILPDQDGDGLADRWETEGIDIDLDGQVDLVLPEADPLHKDLYVEVDAMQGLGPPAQALVLVRQAFANAPNENPDHTTGIRLHFLVDELALLRQALPESENQLATAFNSVRSLGLKTDREIANRPGVTAEKTAAIKKLRAWEEAFRYVLYIPSFSGTLTPVTSRVGYAETPGDDAIVALGSWLEDGVLRTNASVEQHAGVLMHELGHMLGLLHGGGDNIADKPNYFSVMNDLWVTPADSRDSQWKLDYSRKELPTLDENQLREVCETTSESELDCGIGGEEHVFVFAPGLNGGQGRFIDASGPVDWNNDGFIRGETFALDVNGDGQKTLLAGYDDWSNLMFQLAGHPHFHPGGIVSCIAAQGNCDGFTEEATHDVPTPPRSFRNIEDDPHEGSGGNDSAITPTVLQRSYGPNISLDDTNLRDVNFPGQFPDEGIYLAGNLAEGDSQDWFQWTPPGPGIFVVEVWLDGDSVDSINGVSLEMQGSSARPISSLTRNVVNSAKKQRYISRGFFLDGSQSTGANGVLFGLLTSSPVKRYRMGVFFQLAGDATGDNIADLTDFATLRQRFGARTSGLDPDEALAAGDFNLDGTVDVKDAALLRSQFGKRLHKPRQV